MVNQELIEAVRTKKTTAFKQMYEACVPYVYSIVLRYLSNENEHQDVVQEIFARVFLKIDTFDAEKGEFKYWLRKLSVNQCIKHYHKNKQQIDTQSIDEDFIKQVPDEEDYQGISKVEMLTLLKAMPSGYREVFMLIVIDEYSHKEVGEMLKISTETSRSQLHRAKQWLKDNLSKNTLNQMFSVI